MASQANLKTVISADMSGFSATMRRAGSVANSTGKSIGRSMSGATMAIGGLAKGAVLAGSALAGAAASAALFKGMKGAAEIEQMGIAFEVMTGSAEKGRDILEQIRVFGTQTPYEFPALAQGAQTMMAFGVETEKVLPALRMLGDIAAGDSEKMKGLALVYGQIASTGRLMGGDLLQLINGGFNPLQEIAKRTGETMIQLKKRMEAGLIPFAEVEQAFIDATSEGGKFFGMTDRQSRTFNGRMSTLKDSINNALNEFSKPINIALLPHIEALSAKIDEMAPQFIAIGEDIGKRMPEILNGIGEFANGAYKVWQIFQRVGEAIGTIFGTVFSPEYWSAVSDLITGSLMKPFEKLKTVIDAVLSGDSLASAIKQGAEAGAVSDAVVNRAMEKMKPFEDALAAIMRPLEDIGDIFPPSPGSATAGKAAQDSQAGIYDKELEEQRKRVAADAAAMGAKGPSMAWGGSGQSSGNRVDMGGSAGYVAQFDTLQKGLDRYASIGKNNAFSRDRARLGIAGGLSTGGLGAVRAVGARRDSEKKQETLAEKQLTATEEVAKNIREALTVA